MSELKLKISRAVEMKSQVELSNVFSNSARTIKSGAAQLNSIRVNINLTDPSSIPDCCSDLI